MRYKTIMKEIPWKREAMLLSDMGRKVIVEVRREMKYFTPLCNMMLKLSQAESSPSLNEKG